MSAAYYGFGVSTTVYYSGLYALLWYVSGLLITRILYGLTNGKGVFWLSQYGLTGAAFASVSMMAYPMELAAQIFGGWDFNNYLFRGMSVRNQSSETGVKSK